MIEEEKLVFTDEERRETYALLSDIKERLGDALSRDDADCVTNLIKENLSDGIYTRDEFGLNPILNSLRSAWIAIDEIGLSRDAVIAAMLIGIVSADRLSSNDITNKYGSGVAQIVKGLMRIHILYDKNPAIDSDNFRNLLLTFAEDMRVVLLLIADRVNLMRNIKDTTNHEAMRRMSEEAAYLYAPLAHKLGLYKLKSELEDLSLKYLEHDAYYHIKEKLNATKQARDKYIKDFIIPIKEKLEGAGLKFHIKGRTKSIHSIWQKMKKQKCPFEGVYDLFAIRIIIDAPLEQEKQQCWLSYSLITDMYQPNPKRLRDWLSVPKSNGYESLHITVLGPEKKWVEVQIRTERMDDIAEHGLAAHWRYKGIKAGGGMDDFLANIRAALENKDDLQVMDHFRMDLYDKEVFIFSPKGDLFKFPKGATVLDFAYHIHSNVGNHCTGAKINGRNVTLREILNSGDTIDIITNVKQQPKQEWLNIVKSSRAKAKIRQALRELQMKTGAYAKELLERKFRNRKVEMEESLMTRLVKKMGYKETSDFYHDLVEEKLDANAVVEKYVEMKQREENPQIQTVPARSADGYEYHSKALHKTTEEDALVIDKGMKGVDYQLARCCAPIYGDAIFGFVSINGGIKIHRNDCPNAHELKSRFGYRIVKARWSGKGQSQYSITLRVVGNDDIGIVNNLTSIISKEEKLLLRSISIDSHDGLFSGNLVVQIDDTVRLETLMKKLRTIKGVKQVNRI